MPMAMHNVGDEDDALVDDTGERQTGINQLTAAAGERNL
jgi:hypothetical protein